MATLFHFQKRMKLFFLYLGAISARDSLRVKKVDTRPKVSNVGEGPKWTNVPNVVSIDDQSIYDVNKDLNIRDGDIMRDIDGGHIRSTLNDEFYRWELPIPVALSSQANRKTRGEYEEARKEYELRTCVGELITDFTY